MPIPTTSSPTWATPPGASSPQSKCATATKSRPPGAPWRYWEDRHAADSTGQTTRQYHFNQNSFRPPRLGAAGAWDSHVLRPGDVVDRYGGGRDSAYLSPSRTPFAQRSLPSYYQKLPLKQFKVLKPLPILKSRVAAFPSNAPNGGGVQYKPLGGWTIQKLISAGFLAPLD